MKRPTFSNPTLKSRVFLPAVLAISLCAAADATAETRQVRNTRTATGPVTKIEILEGTLEVPAQGAWFVESPTQSNGGMTEFYLRPEIRRIVRKPGKRMARIQDLQTINRRREELRMLYQSCLVYASTESAKGFGPKMIADLAAEKLAAGNEGIYIFPHVKLYDMDNGKVEKLRTAKPLLLDTKPAIDDGKHWVADSLGNLRRVPIDEKAMAKLGLKIVPQKPRHPAAGDKKTPKSIPAKIYARVVGTPAPVKLTLRDFRSDRRIEIAWDPRGAKPGKKAICKAWAGIRMSFVYSPWFPNAPVPLSWAMSLVNQYGLSNDPARWLEASFSPTRGHTATAMGVFGGRAAIMETLQLQSLQSGNSGPSKNSGSNKPIPISKIPGVEVKSHPFSEMLGEQPGGRLPLAEWVPRDRFMLYLPKPDAIFPLLNGGADFAFLTGTMMTARPASYHLKARYLSDLGLSETLMKQFLKTGAIKEMAVVLPDLFLIDGTRITVVMRTGKPLLTNAALALVGVPPGDGTTTKKSRNGTDVHWMRNGDILVVSTGKSEIDAIRKAKESGQSLGASAELRFMLTKVPLTDDTEFYAYFSDPFIRKLVGPETKIAQLRRLQARSELERIQAGALLAQFDGCGDRSWNPEFLQSRKYIFPTRFAGDIAIETGGRCRSKLYGTPARMRPIDALGIDKANETEKAAYDQYRNNYNRYWRRYFDPIAIRYRKTDAKHHELETFILPLIDNTLYNTLRDMLVSEEPPPVLQAPVLSPEPIAMLSCHINDDKFAETLDWFGDWFVRELGWDPAMFDLLDTDVHIALHDSDPIITLGSGELGGLLGNSGSWGSDNMVEIAALISMLTRPTTLYIGLTDPDAMRAQLKHMAHIGSLFMRRRNFLGGTGSIYKIDGRDEWIYRFNIEDVITLRFGLSIQGRYLAITNHPFGNHAKVTGNKELGHRAAVLWINPKACDKQLPALFASAGERERLGAYFGAACLKPLMIAGAGEPTEAARLHHRLFGFEPVHPKGGKWKWDPATGILSSSLYGATGMQRQPAYDPNHKNFGLFRNISRANLAIQFENDGLRSTVQWRTK